MDERECPLCGDRMHLETRETVTRLPGSTQEFKTVATGKEYRCVEGQPLAQVAR